jgi:hypothetical protein
MTRLIVLSALGLLAADVAGAHHAATGLYDRTAVGEVEGEVVSIFWRNPHVRLVIARGVDGAEPEQWEVEFGSVNTLERIGVSREMIAAGDHVTVAGRLGRNGLKALFADSITFADGEELPLNATVERRYGMTDAALASARSADASARADIFRVWLPRDRPQTGRGGTVYPLTPAGHAVQAAWDPAADPALRCVPPGMPTVMDNPYPIEFREQGDTIVLLLEEWDGVRTIYVNGASGEPEQPRMGRSTGRWEGRTLVVETRDTEWRYVDDLGTPQSEDAVIVERFTLSADGTELAWQMRITDPVNFTEPVVMEGVWIWIPGHAIKPFDCTLVDAGD